MGFPGGPVVKNLPCNARDTSLIPGSGRCHMQQEQLSPCATTTEARTPQESAAPTHCK